MATKTKKNLTTLVNGCGTILKENRLKGGYKLVKRKRVKGASTTAKNKVGRPAKAKMVTNIATAPMTAKLVGRPAKAKVVSTATPKGQNAYFTKMNQARKEGANSFEYKGKSYVASKTKTGILVYKTATAPVKATRGRRATVKA